MTLFHLFFLCMFLGNIYLFFVRVKVYQYINDNWERERVLTYYRREDYWVLVGFGFIGILWLVIMLNMHFKFLY